MIPIQHVKLSNMPAKHCAFGPKMNRFLKNSKKILRFIDQNHYGKLSFSQFLLNISWISDAAPNEQTCGRLDQISTKVFGFRVGGERSCVPSALLTQLEPECGPDEFIESNAGSERRCMEQLFRPLRQQITKNQDAFAQALESVSWTG